MIVPQTFLFVSIPLVQLVAIVTTGVCFTLQVNRTIIKLDISSNRVDWDCTPYLARALTMNRRLEVLEVRMLGGGS